VFHIGIDLDRMATDCVLIDQAEPGAAATYLMARALPARDRPAEDVLAGLAGLAEAAGLGLRELLVRTAQYCRGGGKPHLDFKVLRIQVIGVSAPGRDQQALWREFLMISDKLLGLREHPRPEGYRKRLGLGAHAHSALTDGVVSLLTEIVWSGVLPRVSGPAPHAGIGYAVEPSSRAGQVAGLACDRYASMAEVVRLLHVAGGARNVFAAFFLGEVDEVIGTVSVAVMGTPGEPLPAGEVAALVARLNAVSAVERQRLRISLFTDAAEEEIGWLLAEPGAGVVAVWTAGGRSAGAASQAGAPSGPGAPAVPSGLGSGVLT
jgi:hypothetical protein